jgi:hypothetical protein
MNGGWERKMKLSNLLNDLGHLVHRMSYGKPLGESRYVGLVKQGHGPNFVPLSDKEFKLAAAFEYHEAGGKPHGFLEFGLIRPVSIWSGDRAVTLAISQAEADRANADLKNATTDLRLGKIKKSDFPTDGDFVRDHTKVYVPSGRAPV